MAESLIIEKGADRVVTLTIRVSNGHGGAVSIKTSDSALPAATALSIERLTYALSTGDMLISPDDMVITLGGNGAIGATSLTVTATPGLIKQGEVFSLLQNLTGYTIQMQLTRRASDLNAAAIIPIANLTVSVPDQSTIVNRGTVQITFQAADTTSIQADTYYGAIWRRDTNNNHLLWEGDVQIKEAGFLAA